MVTVDATSDSSGDVTVNFVPSLRSSPSDDAVITTTNPVCTMKLTGDRYDLFYKYRRDLWNKL